MRALEELKAALAARRAPSAEGASAFAVAHAAWLLAGSVLAGLLIPPLAEAVRPFVVPLAVLLVPLSALRVEPGRVLAAVSRPLQAAAATGVVLVALPLAAGLGAWLLGAPAWLSTGLALSAAAPPLFPAAGFAAIVGIEAALTTAVSLPATLASPFTIWLVKSVKPGVVDVVDMTQLVSRLMFIVYGGFAVAFFARRVVEPATLARLAPRLEAVTTGLMMLIGLGAMHEINVAVRETPLVWLGVLVATWTVSLGSFALAAALFRPAGRDRAVAVGLTASVKNLAVMAAAVFGAVEPRVIAVVMTAQLPVFLAPLLLRPALVRLGLDAAEGGGAVGRRLAGLAGRVGGGGAAGAAGSGGRAADDGAGEGDAAPVAGEGGDGGPDGGAADGGAADGGAADGGAADGGGADAGGGEGGDASGGRPDGGTRT